MNDLCILGLVLAAVPLVTGQYLRWLRERDE